MILFSIAVLGGQKVLMFLYDQFLGELASERTEQLFKFRGRNVIGFIFIKLGGKNAKFIPQYFTAAPCYIWKTRTC